MVSLLLTLNIFQTFLVFLLFEQVMFAGSRIVFFWSHRYFTVRTNQVSGNTDFIEHIGQAFNFLTLIATKNAATVCVL